MILQRTGRCTEFSVGNTSRQHDLDGPAIIILWSSAASVGRSLSSIGGAKWEALCTVVIDSALITSWIF